MPTAPDDEQAEWDDPQPREREESIRAQLNMNPTDEFLETLEVSK